MTHLILDGSDLDLWRRHRSGGRLVPDGKRPTVLQPDRKTAEDECLRLARYHADGLFVLFAPVAIARRVPECTHVNLRGEPVRHTNVVRLLTIAGGPEDLELPF